MLFVGFVRDVVENHARAAVDGVRQVFGRPDAVHYVLHKRGRAERFKVVLESRCAGKEVVDVQIMVAHSLENDGAQRFAGHVLTRQGLGAPTPLPVGAG